MVFTCLHKQVFDKESDMNWLMKGLVVVITVVASVALMLTMVSGCATTQVADIGDGVARQVKVEGEIPYVGETVYVNHMKGFETSGDYVYVFNWSYYTGQNRIDKRSHTVTLYGGNIFGLDGIGVYAIVRRSEGGIAFIKAGE